jgi:hypothetical protein
LQSEKFCLASTLVKAKLPEVIRELFQSMKSGMLSFQARAKLPSKESHSTLVQDTNLDSNFQVHNQGARLGMGQTADGEEPEPSVWKAPEALHFQILVLLQVQP